ncbi:hypothetical protein [Nocardia sp. NPDC052316]|uniref:hypothetical protein n=1 Tax=Nocardia sp. NPDC052316 TaxID=3364329 RepID=UPI0037C867C9
MILPDGIPVPDQTTWSFETDELEPLLDDVTFAPVDGMTSLPSDGVGRNFVSLRFWQVEDETEPPFNVDANHLLKAFSKVHPGMHQTPEPKTKVSTTPRYRTAVEAVTFVASNDDLVSDGTKPDPLTRCIDKILDWHRVYRVFAESPTPELTYAQIFPIVLTFRRRPADAIVTPSGLIHLSSENIKFGALATDIGNVKLNLLAVGLIRLQLGDPVMTFRERVIDARHEMQYKGNHGSAVIQFGISCEVVFDGLLGMLLWENGVNEADAAIIFSSDITPRLRSEYSPRLGGSWNLQNGPLGDWFEKVATLRNRVVHGGYRPSVQEARNASDSVDALTEFISDRLCEKFRNYPKTAWLFVGLEGFERRNRFSKRVSNWIAEEPPNAVLDWIRDYAEWRERVNAQVQRRRRGA